MMGYGWLAIGLLALGLMIYRGGRIWIDAGHRGFGLAHRLGWALWGAATPASYWWGARIEAMPPEEQDDLLTHETEMLGLSRVDSLSCPLCDAEVPHAWALTTEGRPTVARGPIECPHCDFRLDACRHCAHFLPGSPPGWGQPAWGHSDMTTGRCSQRRTSQPVEEACAPEIARQLKARGYERIRAPMRIMDSFLPPDSCTAFQPERKRLGEGKIAWPDTRRTALLRLLAPPPPRETVPANGLPGDEEMWLL
jgi:hypothetical protein